MCRWSGDRSAGLCRRFSRWCNCGAPAIVSPPSDVGVKPSETLLIALAACAAHDDVEILHGQRVGLARLVVHVTAEQAPEPVWTYRQLHLRFEVQAEAATQERVARAVALALNTARCAPRLSANIAVTFTAELQAPDLLRKVTFCHWWSAKQKRMPERLIVGVGWIVDGEGLAT